MGPEGKKFPNKDSCNMGIAYFSCFTKTRNRNQTEMVKDIIIQGSCTIWYNIIGIPSEGLIISQLTMILTKECENQEY